MVSERNDHDIDVKPLSFITMYKWEDESWTSVKLSASYLQNDQVEATPYFLIPSSKGKFSVYIECEGFQAVKSIGGKADGCWGGLIAYNRKKDGWQARASAGTVLSNYRSTTTVINGHPDCEVNDCKFKPDRGVESDLICSFHLEAEDDSYWALQAPPIQKSSDYNYVVSYGGYTEKSIEWGSVSISIDEVNQTASASPWRGRARKLAILQETAVPPPLPPGGVMDYRLGNREGDQTGTSERGLLKKLPLPKWDLQRSRSPLD